MQYASEPSHAEPVSLLDVRELSFSWPTGQKALDDVTFSLEASERVGLVGPSGAGKSTLLLHLNGLLPESLPTSAENDATVSVNGLAVSRANVNAIRQQVGLLFQDPLDQLFSPTVRDDVAFGPRNLGRPESEVQRCVTMSLGRVGLSDYEDRSPLQLSTGEQKRVCLAGVLACEPDHAGIGRTIKQSRSTRPPRAHQSAEGVFGRDDRGVARPGIRAGDLRPRTRSG